jgi:hypothetical protein
MKTDLRLLEFYKTLARREGLPAEILFHEAAGEFRKAWWLGKLAAVKIHGRSTEADLPPLRLRMKKTWLWLYYDVDEDPLSIYRTLSSAIARQGRYVENPRGIVAGHILRSKAGGDGRAPLGPPRTGMTGPRPLEAQLQETCHDYRCILAEDERDSGWAL